MPHRVTYIQCRCWHDTRAADMNLFGTRVRAGFPIQRSVLHTNEQQLPLLRPAAVCLYGAPPDRVCRALTLACHMSRRTHIQIHDTVLALAWGIMYSMARAAHAHAHVHVHCTCCAMYVHVHCTCACA